MFNISEGVRQLREHVRRGLLHAGIAYDGDMPKVDDASRIQEFMLGDTFQATFDAWAAKVEQEQNGKLVISHQEIILAGTRLLVSWRVEPRLHAGRRR
jgi:hypothetical protein